MNRHARRAAQSRVRSKGRPYSRILRLTALATGKVALIHPTKGLRNRIPTPQLLATVIAGAAA